MQNPSKFLIVVIAILCLAVLAIACGDAPLALPDEESLQGQEGEVDQSGGDPAEGPLFSFHASRPLHNLACSPDVSLSKESGPPRSQLGETPVMPDPRPPVKSTLPSIPYNPTAISPTLLVTTTQLGQIDLRDNHLALGLVVDRGYCIFIWNLATDQIEQIAALPGSLREVLISDQYVVWADELYEPPPPATPCPTEAAAPITPDSSTPAPPCEEPSGQTSTEVYAYNRSTHQRDSEHTPGITRYFMDLAEDTLVWKQYGAGLLGQHLNTGEIFTITTQSANYPRVAGEWVAYVQRADNPVHMKEGNLHLFNWRTGEDTLLGPIWGEVEGKSHTLDHNFLAWVGILVDPNGLSNLVFDLSLYDLNTGEKRQIDIGNNVHRNNPRLSDDNWLLYTQKAWKAVDLADGTTLDLLTSLEGIYDLKYANHRLVWFTYDEATGTFYIFTSTITR